MRLSRYLISFAALSLTAVISCAQNYIIREDRVWVYEGYARVEWNARYEYRMRFYGTTDMDGKLYHNLIVYDAYESWCYWPDPEVHVNDLGHPDKFLLREEDGRVYLSLSYLKEYYDGVDLGTEDCEALIYDFNVKEGDVVTIFTAEGMKEASVTSTQQLTVNGEECSCYQLLIDKLVDFYTIVEGLGNITWGCIPLFYTDMYTGYGSPVRSVPAPLREEYLIMVTDLDGNVIYESNGIWPGEFNSVAQVASDSTLTYDGRTISAGDASITIYDMAGQTVAAGHGSVSTVGLQPGIYFATAGGRTLKILVR